MKKKASIGVFLLGACVAVPALAQTVTGAPGAAHKVTPELPGPVAASPTPNTYGTQDFIEINYPLVGFTPLEDGEWSHIAEGSGWGFRFGGANTATCVDVHLPAGALVYGITTWNNDTDASNDITTEVNRNDLSTSTGTTIFSISTSGTPGIQRAFHAFSPTLTVDNDLKTYSICVFHDAVGPALESAGATLWYKLQVSAGPATATFGDVPTTSAQFKFVEALASAGITAGCGGGNFCPNNFITRGQMAVFLASALGLHFQY